MIIFGIAIIVYYSSVIFFGVLFFMGTVVFGADKLGYKKLQNFSTFF